MGWKSNSRFLLSEKQFPNALFQLLRQYSGLRQTVQHVYQLLRHLPEFRVRRLHQTVKHLVGIMCAVADHKLSSAVGFKGIFRKILIFALVGVGHLLDVQVLGAVGVLRTAVIFFYLSNEGVSLIENAAHLGLPIPAKLKAVLEQLHDRAEKDGENDEQTE